ncbi:Hypothetical predicted protein, partial [Pelobates cultripes]
KHNPATLAAQALIKESGEGSEDSIQMPDFDTETLSTRITKSDLNEALDAQSNKRINIWQHTADSLRKDIQIGKLTSHMEDKCDKFAT